MKRFWNRATAEPTEAGHAVLLDGRPMRIPGGRALILPGRALADAVAAEWQHAGGEKGGEMSMQDVPLTRLAGTAQDRIAPDPAPVADALARYAETDLLCYRADSPADLAQRQDREWQPWLDWLAETHAARLHPTIGLAHLAQEPAALEAIRRALAAEPPGVLAALGLAIPALGSAVLGLAFAKGALDAPAAHAVASLDELFQAQKWGEDVEATRRRAGIAGDLGLAERFIRLSRMP